MESLIETFHIDVKLLIAQIVNFAIVFGVLYFFALKPLIKVMGERSKKIEKSIKDAKKIEDKLTNTEEECKKNINKAKKEANDILEKANSHAEENKKNIIIKAKEGVGQIINQEKAKMQTEKAQTLKEIKLEVADLVVAAVEKVLDEKMDGKKDAALVKRVIQGE